MDIDAAHRRAHLRGQKARPPCAPAEEIFAERGEGKERISECSHNFKFALS
ncbi:hypothetical protein [Thioalkalivibrio sp. HK1]|uniref:hypothetical protein n=1 Tax=Thioalkalivibrio sp. HK1 TaxID=1469245 RepID=UPI0004B21FE1|nr:hypothetical protein [Thioalkalivibrio sp. HK1]